MMRTPSLPNLDSIRSSLKGFVSDLREQRLWPVLAVLLIAIVAVPLVLSKSSSPAPAPVAQVPGATAAPDVPTVTVNSTPTKGAPRGSAHDPFVQQKAASAPGSSTTVATTRPSATAATTAPAASSSSGSSHASTPAASAPATTTPTATTPTTTTPAPTSTTPVTIPAGSTTKVTYFTYKVDVAFGPVGSAAPRYSNVARLTAFPSAKNPILVFLGLQNDRKTLVFLVSSLAAPAGQGKCTPSPRNCEFLSMKAGQRELLLVRDATGGLTEYKLGVQALHVGTTSSQAAAKIAYARESHAGSAIISQAQPHSEGLQEMSYSTRTGTLSWHRAPKAWLRRMQQTRGGVPTAVMLEPLRRR